MSVPTKKQGSPLPESKKDDKEELQKMKRNLEMKEKKTEQEASDSKICLCGSKRMFFLHSKACDGNYYTTPSGVEGEGYMCSIPNISYSDGVMLYFCVECGRIHGFDRDAVQRVIDEIENEDEDASEEDGDEGGSEDEG